LNSVELASSIELLVRRNVFVFDFETFWLVDLHSELFKVVFVFGHPGKPVVVGAFSKSVIGVESDEAMLADRLA
jgi:hypothetical protein